MIMQAIYVYRLQIFTESVIFENVNMIIINRYILVTKVQVLKVG